MSVDARVPKRKRPKQRQSGPHPCKATCAACTRHMWLCSEIIRKLQPSSHTTPVPRFPLGPLGCLCLCRSLYLCENLLFPPSAAYRTYLRPLIAPPSAPSDNRASRNVAPAASYTARAPVFLFGKTIPFIPKRYLETGDNFRHCGLKMR